MATEMLFNGYPMTDLFEIDDVRIGSPEIDVSSKKIPTRNGEIFQGTSFGQRTIEVDIHFIQDQNTQWDSNGNAQASLYQTYMRSIMYYLRTERPEQLSFSFAPDVYYNALMTSIDVQQLIALGQGTITFTCLDSYAHAIEPKTYTAEPNSNLFKVDNMGTESAYPKVTVELLEDAHYLGVVTQNGVIQIGNPDDTATSTNQKIYKYNVQDISGFYQGSQAMLPASDYIFDSEITCNGTLETLKANLVQYEDNDPKKYKGTLMIHNIPNANQSKYFDAMFQVDFSSRASQNTQAFRPDQCAMNEIILYGINNEIIGRLSLRDWFNNYENTVPIVYLGSGNVVYKETATNPKPTTTTYRKVLESEEDIPNGATLVNSYTRPRGYDNVVIDVNNAPVFKYSEVSYKYVKQPYQTTKKVYNKTTKKYETKTVTAYKSVKVENPIKKLAVGKTYRVKAKKSGWYHIYLTSDKKTTGWIQSKYVTFQESQDETVYVYTIKNYTNKNQGKYTDIWARWYISRKPKKGGGDVWEISLYRLHTNGNPATKLFSKTITDKTGTKYTNGQKVAKIGVYMASYGNNPPMQRVSFNHIYFKSLDDNYVESDFHLIGTERDIIEIDFAEPSVTLNGVSILHEVDIGSKFLPLNPFSCTEMELVSDASIYGEVEVNERFL